MRVSRRADDVAHLPLPRHDGDETKYDRGCPLVVGGSPETPGAVLLAGIAALRVGAGRLSLAVDCADATALAVAVPEARVASLQDAPVLARRSDGVVIGPGVLDADSIDPILDLLTADFGDGVLVVDAGALPAVDRHPDWVNRLGGRVLLTPNSAELEALGDTARFDAVIAVRGPSTTITAPDGRRAEIEGGGIGLATSGSGDVWAGVAVGLAARGADPFTVAVWAATLHALAGERLSERVGPIGYLARELLDELPGALETLSP